jgi:flagellar biosynthetic protein FliO
MELIRQILALGLVFGLLTLALWSLRRRGLVRLGGTTRAKKGLRRLEAVERLPLSPQHALHLVRVADRVLLIGVHASGCTLLESLPRQGFEERPLG